ncbi:MAG TPA: wax ester/triacylglycerol synthase domain-containing protein, partial [Burkholderiaceae bacterium]|nr:wax ester/triacylglycerol synthase domain-containing protein [Burkholderiaceae bacterium]
MKSLSGLDGAFLHLETPETPMHVASLSLFDLPPGYRGDFLADVKKLLARRLHLAPVFQRKLAPMPLQFANPAWIHDDNIDLDRHIQRVTLPPPGSPEQFEDCAARLHSQPLDRSRPLWQLTLIDGLRSGQIGYYFKAHHAVLDGQAGVLLAQVLFDVTDKPRAVPHPHAGAKRAEHPGMAELAAAALKHDAGQYIKLLRHLPDVVKTLAGMLAPSAAPARGRLRQNLGFGPHTPLNVQIVGERGFAALSLPLDALKQVATANDAKLNDIVLALCSGTLRRYLAKHGGLPKKPLIAAMPIS